MKMIPILVTMSSISKCIISHLICNDNVVMTDNIIYVPGNAYSKSNIVLFITTNHLTLLGHRGTTARGFTGQPT